MEWTLVDVLSTELDVDCMFAMKYRLVQYIVFAFAFLFNLHVDLAQVRINDVHM